MKQQAAETTERRVLARGSKEYLGAEQPLRWYPAGAPYLALQGVDVRDFALEAYHAEVWKTGEF